MPRVGGSYLIPGTPLRLRGSWGKGFKLPSFFALGNPIVGDPGLRPEKSRGFDVSLRAVAFEERLSAELTYFEIIVKDQIDFQETPPLLVNRSKVVSRGFELGVRLRPIPSIDFAGHVTYTKADIRASDEQLRSRPRWRGALSLAWRPIEAVSLDLAAIFVGEVFDSSIPTGDRILDSYVRVDLAAAWRIWKHAELYLRVDNLFDANYEEAVGFPSPGINPRMGIDIRY
jgi:outer membrane cobalamin receptor